MAKRISLLASLAAIGSFLINAANFCEHHQICLFHRVEEKSNINCGILRAIGQTCLDESQ
jgi:hypothetical protein